MQDVLSGVGMTPSPMARHHARARARAEACARVHTARPPRLLPPARLPRLRGIPSLCPGALYPLNIWRTVWRAVWEAHRIRYFPPLGVRLAAPLRGAARAAARLAQGDTVILAENDSRISA